MKKSTTFTNLVQTLLKEDDVQQILSELNFEDTARKFTAHQLLLFFVNAALGQWSGYRSGVGKAKSCGLAPVCYSTFSSKASEVPYELFKRLFHMLISRCNRETKRRLQLPNDLLLVDSTTITVGKTRLPWALFHGERAGIKLHVALDAVTEQPVQVTETIGTAHDGPIGEQLANKSYILVNDRAYGKIKRFDQYALDKQYFVTRIKENVAMVTPHSLNRMASETSNVSRDITCYLGTPQCQSALRHRVVVFTDNNGKEIRVATNLMHLSAEQVADAYKARWGIEVFFRWIKQNLNVPVLFGTTQNAVFNQLFAALMTYVVLKWLYTHAKSFVISCKSIPLIRFKEQIQHDQLEVEWCIATARVLDKHVYLSSLNNLKTG
ncbi:IS4 family transposase [Paenibacillus sp. N3.4]|uniref:IS4 family transposase n=1 Tax=Paenibacillus sp. N3.4 TaxID=2603222 RepID=UPI0011C7A74F|nr:IS4 family transposase [Paenibacillus sp. N3.4]TXK65375.1 IS4 family transposase [Paenibacillus sp. N3.4]